MGYKVNKIYIYQNGVEKQVRPDVRVPDSSRTLLYLPLKEDVVDKSGNSGRTFTTSGVSYTTVGGVPSIHIGTTGGLKLTAPYPIQPTVTKPMTLSILVKLNTSGQTSYRRCIYDIAATNGNRLFRVFKENATNIQFGNQDTDIYAQFTNYSSNRMHLVVTGVVGQPLKMYINGELKTTGGTNVTRPRGNWASSSDNTQAIFCVRNVNTFTAGLDGNARELIMEQVEWSDNYISQYYNWIKGKLGF